MRFIIKNIVFAALYLFFSRCGAGVGPFSGQNIVGSPGSLTFAIPAGYYDGTQTASCTDPNLATTSILSGTKIFGVVGTLYFGNLSGSNEHHNLISSGDFTQEQEIDQGSCSITAYTTRMGCEANSGLWSPTWMPSTYRDVPNILTDDDGYVGGNVTPVTRTGWAAGTTCGTSGTIAARIANCAANSTIGVNASWNGAINGNAGFGVWNLVTRAGTGDEVWQDSRTQLIWSSLLAYTVNWCTAAGNAQSNDPTGDCNNVAGTVCSGAVCQPNYPVAQSYCSEDAGTMPALGTENWGSGTYDLRKGGMGKNAPTSIMWRLPTKYDYQQADNDGIRFVLPDIGPNGSSWEWTASVVSLTRANAWAFVDYTGDLNSSNTRVTPHAVRCVGR